MSIAAKPIETRYRGHRFRSRLEARWAVAFDAAQIQWNYEPEGFTLDLIGPYLPDFWLPQLNAWAEVKPVEPTLLELQKARALSIGTGNPVLLLVGKPAMASYWAIWEGCGLVKPWKPGDDPEERVHADDITYKAFLEDGSCVRVSDFNLWGFSFRDWQKHREATPFNCDSLALFPDDDQFPFPTPCTDLHPSWFERTAMKPVDAAASARFEFGESGAA